jgi:hypothetical protein
MQATRFARRNEDSSIDYRDEMCIRNEIQDTAGPGAIDT